MIVLGIESSCDETSIALIRDGSVLSSKTYTQEVHSAYGGVVPEIASRAHVQKVDRLCTAVLDEAAVALSDVNLVAVTDCPGLAGALLVGISFALGIHAGHGIPVAGVNHLEGHIASVTLAHPTIAFPFLALVVSGGHTAIYRVDDFGKYVLLGQTIDDAAGEAFDKVGKLIGFAYPAGREIENTARQYRGTDLIRFPIAKLKKPVGIDFSFSGLKTAVKYHVEQNGVAPEELPRLCASFQDAVIRTLVSNALEASRESNIPRVALVGGVACNGTLREALAEAFGDQFYAPPPNLCTDNAAMIAKAGYERHIRNMSRHPHMSPSSGL